MTLKNLLLSTLVFLAGCSTSPSGPTEVLNIPSFHFDPEVVAPAGSAKLNIILVNPKYASTFKYSGAEPYRSFARSMGDDFEELLIARGYIVQGPYDSYDEIVFSVKENADLIIESDIDITANISGLKLRHAPKFNLLEIMVAPDGEAPLYYNISGAIGLSGKVSIKAYEPMTQEKMWVKSVPIEGVRVPVASTIAWRNDYISKGAYYSDPGIHNPTLEALRGVYDNALSKAYIYLDPRELQMLKPEIKRIKDKVRF